MTTLRTAATKALEVLVRASSYYDTYAEIAALEAALAEPVQRKEHCLWARNGNEPCPHVQQAEPVEPVAVHQFRKRGCIDWFDGHPDHTDGGGPYVSRTLYTSPPQRKPPATIDEMFDRMDKAPKGVFFGHDPMTIWMEAWRSAERAHGIG